MNETRDKIRNVDERIKDLSLAVLRLSPQFKKLYERFAAANEEAAKIRSLLLSIRGFGIPPKGSAP